MTTGHIHVVSSKVRPLLVVDVTGGKLLLWSISIDIISPLKATN